MAISWILIAVVAPPPVASAVHSDARRSFSGFTGDSLTKTVDKMRMGIGSGASLQRRRIRHRDVQQVKRVSQDQPASRFQRPAQRQPPSKPARKSIKRRGDTHVRRFEGLRRIQGASRLRPHQTIAGQPFSAATLLQAHCPSSPLEHQQTTNAPAPSAPIRLNVHPFTARSERMTKCIALRRVSTVKPRLN